MTFTPLNKKEETEIDIQKHIHEVELENALKLYQDALKLHSLGSYDAAANAYESLLSLEVLQEVLRKGPDARRHIDSGTLSNVHSSVTLLPYLIFKNHGTLLLDKLRKDIQSTSPEDIHETLMQIIVEYATALSFDSKDQALWGRIGALSKMLDLKRVRRFALETEVGDCTDISNAARGLLWDSGATIHKQLSRRDLLQLFEDLGDIHTLRRYKDADYTDSFDARIVPEEEFAWLLDYSSTGNTTRHTLPTVEILTVQPSNCSWYALTRALVEKHRVSSSSQAHAPIHLTFDIPKQYTSAASPSSDSNIELDVSEDLSQHETSSDSTTPTEKHVELDTSRLLTEPETDSARFSDDMYLDQDNLGINSPTAEASGENDSEGSEPGQASATSSLAPSSPSRSSVLPHTSEALYAEHNHEKLEDMDMDLDHAPSNNLYRQAQQRDDVEALGQEYSKENESDIYQHEEQGRANREDTVPISDEEKMLPGSPAQSITPSPPMSHKRPMAHAEDKEDDEEEDDDNLRASKRVKQRAVQEYGAQDNQFHETLGRLFADLHISLDNLFSLNPDPRMALDSELDHPNVYSDFRTFLYNDWHDEKVQNSRSMLVTNDTAFSKTMMLSYPALIMPKKDAECGRSAMMDFVEKIEKGRTYFRFVNVELIFTLLGSSGLDGEAAMSSYLDNTWSAHFRNLVLRLIQIEESLLRDRANLGLASSCESQHITLNALSCSQAILELSLDEFIASEKERLEQSSDEVNTTLYDRVCRWRDQVQQLLCDMKEESTFVAAIMNRYQWACALMIQFAGTSVEETVSAYITLRAIMIQQGDSNAVVLPNCQTMHNIDLKHLDLEISKFSTMDFFNAIFLSQEVQDHKAVVTHLRPILLLDANDQNSSKNSAIREYLHNSPTEFRCQLWQIFSHACEVENEVDSALVSYLTTMDLTLELLSTDEYTDSSLANRQEKLLQTLARFSIPLGAAFSLALQDINLLQISNPSRLSYMLTALFRCVAVLQVFVYYEDAATEDETLVRKSLTYIQFRDRCRDDFVRCWYLIYQVYKAVLQRSELDLDIIGQRLATFINVLHDELGTRGYCSLLQSKLLDLFENEIFRLDRAETEADLVQVLHCKYDVSYQIGAVFPWEHHAKGSFLSQESALRILPFVLSFVVERSPGVWLPKADVRNALEKLEIVAWPLLEDSRLQIRNRLVLDNFLSREISPKDFKGCLVGSLEIEIADVSAMPNVVEKQWNALVNSSLMLGRIYLSTYKARNKNNAKGLSDLEEARNYYFSDLCVTPSRVESWRALAYIYSVLADHELSYDAQRIGKHKTDIVSLKRKTLLCYMMATSLSVREGRSQIARSDTQPTVFADLLFEFGMQIYSASRAPYAMACFERSSTRYLETGKERPDEESQPVVTEILAWQVCSGCLYRASETCAEQWRCHLYLGKVRSKLKIKPEQVLTNFVRSIETAPKQSQVEQGFLFDPHYRIISSVYKYLLNGNIEIATARHYLLASFWAEKHLHAATLTRNDVFDVIQAALQDICNADRKHWHHRPVYRLAMMAYDLASTDPDSSNNEATRLSTIKPKIENLFTAKGSASNLLSIWRPEFERSGRHFYYAYLYTNSYIEILYAHGDMDLVRSVMKRLRKATQAVLDHTILWTKICKLYFEETAKQSGLTVQDTSDILDVMELNVFNKIASEVDVLIADSSQDPPAMLRVLREYNEVRKLNGGLYDTNIIDAAMIDCYVTLFRSISQTSKSSGIEEDLAIEKSGDACIPGLPFSESRTQIHNEVELHTPEALSRSVVLNHSDTTDIQVSDTKILNDAPAAKARGRTKEVKVARVTRRDLLTKAFALCRPKPNPAEAKQRQESSRTRHRGEVELERDENLAPESSTVSAVIEPDWTDAADIDGQVVAGGAGHSPSQVQPPITGLINLIDVGADHDQMRDVSAVEESNQSVGASVNQGQPATVVDDLETTIPERPATQANTFRPNGTTEHFDWDDTTMVDS